MDQRSRTISTEWVPTVLRFCDLTGSVCLCVCVDRKQEVRALPVSRFISSSVVSVSALPVLSGRKQTERLRPRSLFLSTYGAAEALPCSYLSFGKSVPGSGCTSSPEGTWRRAGWTWRNQEEPGRDLEKPGGGLVDQFPISWHSPEFPASWRRDNFSDMSFRTGVPLLSMVSP